MCIGRNVQTNTQSGNRTVLRCQQCKCIIKASVVDLKSQFKLMYPNDVLLHLCYSLDLNKIIAESIMMGSVQTVCRDDEGLYSN